MFRAEITSNQKSVSQRANIFIALFLFNYVPWGEVDRSDRQFSIAVLCLYLFAECGPRHILLVRDVL
jgi:hypothetical protein